LQWPSQSPASQNIVILDLWSAFASISSL
jgi:hypothetical protein